MDEVNAEYKVDRNSFGKTVQTLRFNEGNLLRKESRTKWINEDEALEYLREVFNFQNGNEYRIKYLVSKGWRSGGTFLKNNNTNLSEHVYSHETEAEMYTGQGLTFDNIHIFGIEVLQVKSRQEIDWQNFFDNEDENDDVDDEKK